MFFGCKNLIFFPRAVSSVAVLLFGLTLRLVGGGGVGIGCFIFGKKFEVGPVMDL